MTNIVIFVILFGALGMWSVWALWREADKVHGALREFKCRAVAAKTDEELETIRLELISYAERACWHRHFGNHAREVMSYIQGKRSRIQP